MTGPLVMLVGIGLWAVAFAITISKSIGGTCRNSDADSHVIASFGSLTILAGFFLTVWEYFA